MSLKNKVIVIIVSLFVVYGVLDIGVQRFVIMPSFNELERKEATKNAERVIQTVGRELHHLGLSVVDWAYWDDTYKFVSGDNPGFIESNLYLSTFTGLNVHLMHFYNTKGNLVWGKVFDLTTGKEVEVPGFVKGALPGESMLLKHSALDSAVSGVFMTARGPMLMVSKPVLTSERQGPIAGTMVMGRFLDDAAVKALAEQARVDFNITPLTGPNAAEHDALKRITSESPIHIQQLDGVSQVFATISGVDGNPALLLQVNVPREISAHGESAVRYAIASLATAGVLVLVAFLWLLHRTVFGPVTSLTNYVIRLGKGEEFDTRIDMARDDEIGTLAQEFDRMVDRLAQARRQLIEKSYESGVAEMASGVLHNVGNALTPVTVGLANVSQRLREAPVAEVEQAFAELDSKAGPAERTAALEQFVTMAAQELAGIVCDARQDLDATANQIGHIEHILSDQEKFSRKDRILESIDVNELVNESLGFINEELLASITITRDPVLKDLRAVMGARTALQQTISNLVINAAEAIQQSSVSDGRIEISAEETSVEDRQMLHLRIADNGSGISPEDLGRIFERGVTSKPSGNSGLGLHWSANTVAVLDGRLYAESEGSGRGACLHLFLPLASVPLASVPLASAAAGVVIEEAA